MPLVSGKRQLNARLLHIHANGSLYVVVYRSFPSPPLSPLIWLPANATTRSNTMSCPTYRHPAESLVHGYLYSMVEMSVVRTFCEYKVFEAIPDGGIALADLAAQTKVDVGLLERFASYLVAVGVLTAPAPGRVDHGEISKFLTTPKAAFWYPYLFDTFLGSATKWTDFFKLNGPAEPHKSTLSPFGFAAGFPDKTFYEVIQQMPEKQSAFNAAMTFGLGDMPITGVYDFTWLAEYADPSGSPSRVRLVDVGGGRGQALKAILQENPRIPARHCVLEDREPTIKEAIADADAEATGAFKEVQKIPHNFFDEQPVKGDPLPRSAGWESTRTNPVILQVPWSTTSGVS